MGRYEKRPRKGGAVIHTMLSQLTVSALFILSIRIRPRRITTARLTRTMRMLLWVVMNIGKAPFRMGLLNMR